MTAIMDRQLAGLALQLFQRMTIAGAEADVFIRVRQALLAIADGSAVVTEPPAASDEIYRLRPMADAGE